MEPQYTHYHVTINGDKITAGHSKSVVAHCQQTYLAKSPKSRQRIHRLAMPNTQLFWICATILVSMSTASIHEEGIACTAMALAMPELLTLQGEICNECKSPTKLPPFYPVRSSIYFVDYCVAFIATYYSLNTVCKV